MMVHFYVSLHSVKKPNNLEHGCFYHSVQSIKRLFDVNGIPCCCLDSAEVDQ